MSPHPLQKDRSRLPVRALTLFVLQRSPHCSERIAPKRVRCSSRLRSPCQPSALRARHPPAWRHRSASASASAQRSSIGDLELPTRRRRRRAPADHTQARHGKAVFRPDRPRVFKTATYVRTPQPPPQTNPELRNLHPNRTSSRQTTTTPATPFLASTRKQQLRTPQQQLSLAIGKLRRTCCAD
jgi:hypothetical protein